MATLQVYLTGRLHKHSVALDEAINTNLSQHDVGQDKAKIITTSGFFAKDQAGNLFFYPPNRIRKVKITQN